MSVQPRPTDNRSANWLQIGQPYFEIGERVSTGVFNPFESVGIIQNSELAKVVENLELRSAQSGTDLLVRRIVRLLEPTLNIGVVALTPENAKYIFAANGVTQVTGGTSALTNRPFTLSSDGLVFVDLPDQLITEAGFVARPAEIALESVGIGDGATLTFSLDFKPLVVADVTSFTVGGVERVGDIVAGGAPGAGQIGIEEGTGATSGDIVFPGGEAPALGAEILATYQPSHSFTVNTDYSLDPNPGRIRFFNVGGATDALKAFQPMEGDYTITTVNRFDMAPFTRNAVLGRARLRMLTDVGINFIWTIPSIGIRITDAAIPFSATELNVFELAVDLLADTTNPTQPYGTLQLFEETP